MADFLSKKERSALMSRIRSKNTTIEKIMFREIRAAGLYFRRNDSRLPGSPDLVFPRYRVVVFLDGGFWHGYRYPVWGRKLEPFWRKKIETNVARDKRNRRKLRTLGWRVVRIWQHEIQSDPQLAALKILDACEGSREF